MARTRLHPVEVQWYVLPRMICAPARRTSSGCSPRTTPLSDRHERGVCTRPCGSSTSGARRADRRFEREVKHRHAARSPSHPVRVEPVPRGHRVAIGGTSRRGREGADDMSRVERGRWKLVSRRRPREAIPGVIRRGSRRAGRSARARPPHSRGRAPPSCRPPICAPRAPASRRRRGRTLGDFVSLDVHSAPRAMRLHGRTSRARLRGRSARARTPGLDRGEDAA